MTKRQYPLTIRDVGPGPGAVRMTGTRNGGGTDGFHTGGAWFYENKVWKPLDGRPYANAQIHVETNEEECLTKLQGKSLFPKNWEVKEVNGRKFLIRDKVQTFPKGGLSLTLAQLQEIDKGVTQMNQAGWEVNDDIVIGRDRAGKLFIVDLSAAAHNTITTGPLAANDKHHVDALFVEAGFKDLVVLRKSAAEMRSLFVLGRGFDKIINKKEYRYVYSSNSKVDLKDLIDISEIANKLMGADRSVAKDYFWYISKKQLADPVVRSKNLTLRVS